MPLPFDPEEGERQVSIPELEALAKRAAKAVAPVFEAEEWIWWDGRIPDETRIEMEILRMLLDCPLGGIRATGHLHITRALESDYERFEVKLAVDELLG